jgi:uncharacterized membrane protein YhaH (DUF805 family)
MNYYFAVLKKYAVFSGRAGRKEYWFFILFNTIVMLLLLAVDSAMGSAIDPDGGGGFLSTIYLLGVIIPTIAVGVRRLHHTDRTGWWTLIYFIPLIGPLVFLYFTVLASDDGVNRFGESPLDEL